MRNSIGVLEPKSPVVLYFHDSGTIKNAQVEAFTVKNETVYYDISVKVQKAGAERPVFVNLERVHSSNVWEPDEYEKYRTAVAGEQRNPTRFELQAMIHKMDFYKSDRGFIAPVWGGELTFFETDPGYQSRPTTRDEVLKMIDES